MQHLESAWNFLHNQSEKRVDEMFLKCYILTVMLKFAKKRRVLFYNGRW